MDVKWERVDVGALQLRELPIFHQQDWQCVSFVGQLLQDGGVGGCAARGLLENGKLQFLKQNLTQLGVGVDVELLAGDGVDLLLDSFALALETLLERGEP